MNQLMATQINGTPNLTSVEIAELTGKLHKHVMTDIRKMFGQLGIDSADFSAQYQDSTGRKLPCYSLPPREVKILITGYDVVRRAKVIDRLEQLEQAVKSLPTMTQAQIIAAIAQQHAEQEQRVAAIEQQVKRLEAKVSQENDYFSVLGYTRLQGFVITNNDAIQAGRRAAKLSRERGLPIGDVTDPRFGSVHTYHSSVLDQVFAT